MLYRIDKIFWSPKNTKPESLKIRLWLTRHFLDMNYDQNSFDLFFSHS